MIRIIANQLCHYKQNQIVSNIGRDVLDEATTKKPQEAKAAK